MKIADLCSPHVKVVYPDQPLAEAARMLCDEHIGILPVVRRDNPKHAIGILTDRDAVRGQFQRKADLFCLSVEDAMSRDPCVLAADTELAEALEVLSARRVRRAPVVNARGEMIGLLSLDDVMPEIARDLAALAQLMAGQWRAERTTSRPG